MPPPRSARDKVAPTLSGRPCGDATNWPQNIQTDSGGGTVKLLGGSRELGELDGERASGAYAACLMPQTSCHAWKARVRSAR
jgi:hypothetical protein